MGENMYSPGQKTYTKQGMENFDRIFGKDKCKCCKDCACKGGGKKKKGK